MDTIEKIHQDFDLAVDRLKKIAEDRKKEAESLKNPQKSEFFDDAQFLDDLGFRNVSIVDQKNNYKKTVEKINKERRQKSHVSESIERNIELFTNIFPFHKFILYSQVIQICEDYNLYLGPVSFYKGNIPQKNIDEIKNFPFDTYRSGDFDRWLRLVPHEPICNQRMEKEHFSNGISLYICAPLNEFNRKNTNITGKEIYENKFDLNPLRLEIPKKMPKDPIVLLPVRVKGLNDPGFIVITKWGKEAEDSRLVVPMNN